MEQTELQRQNTYRMAGIQLPPIPTTTMNAGQLNTPMPAVNLASYIPTPVPDISSLGVAPAPTETGGTPATVEQPQAGIFSRLNSALQGITQKISGGKEVDTQEAKLAATSPSESALSSLNAQIKMFQAKALQNQELALRTGETQGFATGNAQQQQRTDAIQAMFLQGQADAIRGDIATAERRVEEAVNAKYGQARQEQNTIRQQIIDNYDSFTAADKKKANTVLLQIDKDDQYIKMQMEDTKITQGFIQEAIAQSAQNGVSIPQTILNRASRMDDPTEALRILAPYMVDANEKATALEELKGKRLQNQKTQLEIDEIKNPSNTGVVTASGKPLTEGQSASLGYAKRIAEAKAVIDQIGNQFTGGESYFGQLNPFNTLKSESRQMFEQAQRNFVNAVLRKESGAAISPTEFDSAKQQYFPQPGDMAGTLKQKKQNRDTVYQNFLQSAGNPPSAEDTKVVKGITYKREKDGLYYPQ